MNNVMLCYKLFSGKNAYKSYLKFSWERQTDRQKDIWILGPRYEVAVVLEIVDPNLKTGSMRNIKMDIQNTWILCQILAYSDKMFLPAG